MRLLTKEFYTLAELQAAWEMADHDIQYLIATGRLKLSIVAYSQTLVTMPSGPHLPTDAKRRVYSGMLDLNASDAVAILRKGEAQIACFSMPDGAAGYFPYYFRNQTVTKVDELMVRHAERERAERQWLASRASDGTGPFGHSADYRAVHMHDRKFTLGPKQAGVIQHLHRAHEEGDRRCRPAGCIRQYRPQAGLDRLGRGTGQAGPGRPYRAAWTGCSCAKGHLLALRSHALAAGSRPPAAHGSAPV